MKDIFNLDFMSDEKFDDDFFMSTKSNKRVYFNLQKSFEIIKQTLELPKENESIRMISPVGGWSSCTLLMFIIDKIVADELIITTLRVGTKEMDTLCDLIEKKELKKQQ